MSGPSLFDAAAGAAARDEALEQVEAHAAPGWKQAALDIVHELSATTADFTSEDVWELLNARELNGTPEPRALGAIMTRAKTLGWIAGTDRTRKSQLPQQHRLLQQRFRLCGQTRPICRMLKAGCRLSTH